MGCSQTNLRNKGELLTFNKNGMKNFFLLSDRIPQKLNPIQDKHFRGCSRMVAPNRLPLPKICHTYPTMMKLGAVILLPKEDSKKYMNHVTHLLTSADISIFSPEISKFCYIKKYRYRLHFDT